LCREACCRGGAGRPAAIHGHQVPARRARGHRLGYIGEPANSSSTVQYRVGELSVGRQSTLREAAQGGGARQGCGRGCVSVTGAVRGAVRGHACCGGPEGGQLGAQAWGGPSGGKAVSAAGAAGLPTTPRRSRPGKGRAQRRQRLGRCGRPERRGPQAGRGQDTARWVGCGSRGPQLPRRSRCGGSWGDRAETARRYRAFIREQQHERQGEGCHGAHGVALPAARAAGQSRDRSGQQRPGSTGDGARIFVEYRRSSTLFYILDITNLRRR